MEVKAGTDPTLTEIMKKKSLRWIFVGGKGGVGKTTISSSLAIRLASRRASVLIISTDPAHSLSDAFSQKFTSSPSLIKGFINLYGMEIDPSKKKKIFDLRSIIEEKNTSAYKQLMSELSSSVPGIDEAASFAEVLKSIKDEKYSTIVFDTAPTGHTLRLLSFPKVIENALQRATALKQKYSKMVSSVASAIGMQNPATVLDKFSKYLEILKVNIDAVNKQFKDPNATTFIGVCIAELLSLYETEKMIGELDKFGIHINTLVINQVIYPEQDSDCRLCVGRAKMQKKYIDMYKELYSDFHLVQTPLLYKEIRGVDRLKNFSWHFVKT